MTELPKISIVTPSYNQGRFLEKTIKSVIGQEYPNYEYIIVDGGSDDESVEIIKKYEKHLQYWVSEKDKGQSDAINKGFEVATGDIFAWLNSDDIYFQNTFLKVAKYFMENSKTQVVYGNVKLIDENDHVAGERRFIRYITAFLRYGFLHGGFGISQPATFWRRQLYEKVEGLDVDLVHCMDTDLFVKYAIRNARFRFIRDYLSGFRIHKHSKSCNLQEIANKEVEYIQNKYGRGEKGSFLLRNVIRLIKIAIYTIQGDGIWLLRRYIDKKTAKSAISKIP